MVMASNLHSFSHLPQPIQATSQDFLATAPLSLFTQLTKMRRLLGPMLRRSIMSLGQASTQAPQATQFSSMITGRPVSSSMYMASNLQAATQSPQPRPPYEQPVSPPYSVAATAQDMAPW